PIAPAKLPCGSSTITGDMDERGRLPGAMALAAAPPGCQEKSVSWLLSSIPPATRPEPKYDSIVVVIETALPSPSTTTKWLVPAGSAVSSAILSGAPAGRPGENAPVAA